MNKKELLLGDYFGGGKQSHSKRQPTDQRFEQAIGHAYGRICEMVQQVPTESFRRDSTSRWIPRMKRPPTNCQA